MLSFSRRTQVFAIGSAWLAGFVDAIAFIHLGGFFVSFMSGNSTRLGVGVAYAWPDAGLAAALIGCFVLGVVLGSSLGRIVVRRRRRWLMLGVAALLALAASVGAVGPPVASGLLLAVAMGAVNAVLEENGESRVGLTYMTGALVRVGQHLTTALFGGRRWGWAPYLLLWTGLASGASMGALMFRAVGLNALWVAVAVATGLAALVGERTD